MDVSPGSDLLPVYFVRVYVCVCVCVKPSYRNSILLTFQIVRRTRKINAARNVQNLAYSAIANAPDRILQLAVTQVCTASKMSSDHHHLLAYRDAAESRKIRQLRKRRKVTNLSSVCASKQLADGRNSAVPPPPPVTLCIGDTASSSSSSSYANGRELSSSFAALPPPPLSSLSLSLSLRPSLEHRSTWSVSQPAGRPVADQRHGTSPVRSGTARVGRRHYNRRTNGRSEKFSRC